MRGIRNFWNLGGGGDSEGIRVCQVRQKSGYSINEGGYKGTKLRRKFFLPIGDRNGRKEGPEGTVNSVHGRKTGTTENILRYLKKGLGVYPSPKGRGGRALCRGVQLLRRYGTGPAPLAIANTQEDSVIKEIECKRKGKGGAGRKQWEEEQANKTNK